MGTGDTTGAAGAGSCGPLAEFRADVDAMMAHLLTAAVAVKQEQNLSTNAEAFDYTVSFLSGFYRAMAILARDATIEAMP
ncbi:MAG TPA: hypothetical protein VGM51_09275 [Armatimonadota bacterium]